MTDAAIRTAAGLAALALLASPAVLAGLRKAKAWYESRAVEGPAEKAPAIGLGEMRIVLDLAAKLKAAGNADGVALCQQLLDVMLGNTKAKK